jgi:hypothetical protein
VARTATSGLDAAFRNVSIRPIDVPIRFDIPELPTFEGGATGGLVTARGIQHFGVGGRVLPFLRRGTDTVPAMLTPGEIILTAAQQRGVAAALGGTTVVNNITVENNRDISTIADEQRLARRVGAAIVADVNRSTRRGA